MIRTRLLIVGGVIAGWVIACVIAAVTLPARWAEWIGARVGGSASGGAGLGLLVGFAFTAGAVVALGLALVRRRSRLGRAALMALAVALLLPNLFTLGVVLGTSSTARAAERALDLEAPDFAAGSLGGAIIAVAVACTAGCAILARRRRAGRRARAHAELRSHEASARAALLAEETGAARRDVRICFVCLGNICRSPTAEAVMRHLVTGAGLAGAIAVESAGTGSWHLGGPADPRAAAELRARGIPVHGTARQFIARDFARFDMIVAMDEQNAADLRALAPDAHEAAKVRLLREFDPAAAGDLSLPDPYSGGQEDFAKMFGLVDRGCRGLLEHLSATAVSRA